VVALALSGAHAYGFPSPDSDLDLKGIHVTGARALLGLKPKPESRDALVDFEGREHDYTTNDLGAAMTQLLAGNGNFIERLLGPFPLIETAAGRRLAELARQSLSRRVHHHYRGFMGGVLREYAREKAKGEQKAKRLLYAYRTALTGMHLLRAGELETDVRPLARRYGYAASVEALISVKTEAEHAFVDEDRPYLDELTEVEAELARARDASVLPERPLNVEAVERFVIELRLAAG
jgi:hypothetical protein